APPANESTALVRIMAASINPSDVKNVAGAMTQTTLPRIPGRDFAGVVEAGPAKWIGAEAWGTGGDTGFTRDGTHAELIAVPAEVRVATAGKGADVVFDLVGGVMFRSAVDSLALRGRLIEIAATGQREVSFDLADFYHNESRLIGVDTLKRDLTASAQVLEAL